MSINHSVPHNAREVQTAKRSKEFMHTPFSFYWCGLTHVHTHLFVGSFVNLKDRGHFKTFYCKCTISNKTRPRTT